MPVSSSCIPWSRERTCPHLRMAVRVSDRQERIPGWRQDRLSDARIVLVGAGGTGSEYALGAARKGTGVLHIVDQGLVEPPDLGRQLYVASSLFKPKASEACRLLSKQGFLGTHLVPHRSIIQNISLSELKPSVVVCCVDNQITGTRAYLAKECHRLSIPLVVVAVSTDADHGYVFVQVPGGPCWACALGGCEPKTPGCPGVPAAIDILKSVAGLALYAVDTLLMDRKRDWNYRSLSLSRSEFGAGLMVEKKSSCPTCGGHA